MNNRSKWATPPDFFSVVDAEFHFKMDVAASVENTKCPRFITEEQNAISMRDKIPWITEDCKSAYCNPPFSNLMPWIWRAEYEAAKFPDAVVGFLAPSSHAQWMQQAEKSACEIRLLYPRVNFISPSKTIKTSCNDRDTVFIVFKRKTKRAAHIFFWNWKLPIRRKDLFDGNHD